MWKAFLVVFNRYICIVFCNWSILSLINSLSAIFFGANSLLLTFDFYLLDFLYVLVILYLEYFLWSSFSTLYKLPALSAGTITLLVYFIYLMSFASCSWKVLLTLLNSIFIVNDDKLSSKPINSSIVCGYFRDFSPYVSFLLLASFPRNCSAFQRILFKTLSTFDLFLSWTWYILVGIVCVESFHDRSFNTKVLTLIEASTWQRLSSMHIKSFHSNLISIT